jgi:DHA1 family multidrug resistance protein-like MFS transporter
MRDASTMITKVFPILALGVFSATLGMGIVSPLLPLYADAMGATGIWLGIIIAAFAISHGIITPIAGRLSDRSGRKPFLGIGLLVCSIVSLGYIWAANVYQLALVRLINGAGAAMTTPIALAYVGDLSPEGEEGKWMGYAQAAFFSGFGIGPLMGGVLTDHFGMTVCFSTMGGLNLLAFLVALFFLPEVRRRKMATSPPLSFKEMRASGIIKGIFSFRLTESIGRGSITTFLPIFAAMIGLSITRIGILLAVTILTLSMLGPVGGMIADRFNRRFLIVLGQSIFTIAMVAIPMTNSFEPLFSVLLIQGISGAICIPAASAMIVKEGRSYGMGSAMSALFVAMGIGMATGPLLGGVVADFVNIDSVFYVAAGMGVIGTGLLIWFSR